MFFFHFVSSLLALSFLLVRFIVMYYLFFLTNVNVRLLPFGGVCFSLYRYIFTIQIRVWARSNRKRTCYIGSYVVYFMILWLVLVSFHYDSFNPSFSGFSVVSFHCVCCLCCSYTSDTRCVHIRLLLDVVDVRPIEAHIKNTYTAHTHNTHTVC